MGEQFLLEPAFTRLAFAVAWSVLAALELARAARVPPLGAAVHRFMAPFADARDAGVLFVTCAPTRTQGRAGG